MCLWVESGVVNGRYGDSSVTGSTSLTGGQWHNIIFRHSIEGRISRRIGIYKYCVAIYNVTSGHKIHGNFTFSS